MEVSRTDAVPTPVPRPSQAEQFRLLIENASDLIAILNADGTIRYASPSHQRILGYAPEEMVGRSTYQLIHPDDVARVIGGFTASLDRNGVTPAIEFRIQHRNGSWRMIEAIGNNLLADPNIAGMVLNSRDVTERKLAERKTATLLAVAKAISGTLDRDELLARVQQQAAEVLGCDAVATFWHHPAEEVFRLVSHHGIPPALLPRAQALAVPSGTPFDQQLTAGQAVLINDIAAQAWLHMISNGSRHQLSALIIAPLAVRGQTRGVIVAISTAPGRLFDAGQVELCEGIARQVAVALEAAELYAGQKEEAQVSGALARVGGELIASVDTPVLLNRLCQLTCEVLGCDLSHTFLWQAEDHCYVPVSGHGDTPEQWEALRVLRVPHAVVAGLVDKLTRQELVQVAMAEPQDLLPAAVPQKYGITAGLYVAIRRGEDMIGVLTAGYRGGAGRFSRQQERVARGIANLASLALANARLVEELERAGRLKSDFVATISHELRTPLNRILGYNDLLLDGAFGPRTETEADILRRIRKSARDLLGLINATLDLGRLESGRAPVERRHVQLAALFEELREEVHEGGEKPGVQLVWETGPRLPRLRTDPVKLKVVLKSLVDNARKFTDHGVVRVAVARADGGVEFCVSDTGIGIAPEVLPIIFEPFRQGERANTRRHGGAGLGLYVVRRLLEVLGGTIAVESEVGCGSRFRVWLPIRCKT